MKNTQQGFSLIEIAVALSIIILLAALIMFSYNRYIERSRIVEVVNVTSQIRQEIAKHVAKYRKLPNDIAAFMQKILSAQGQTEAKQRITFQYSATSDRLEGAIKLFIYKVSPSQSEDGSGEQQSAPQVYLDRVKVFNGNPEFTCGTSDISSEQMPDYLLPAECRTAFSDSDIPGELISSGDNSGVTHHDTGSSPLGGNSGSSSSTASSGSTGSTGSTGSAGSTGSIDSTGTYGYSSFTDAGQVAADYASNIDGRNVVSFHSSSSSVLVNACPGGKEEKLGGLCYTPCRAGYIRYDENPSLCMKTCDTSKDWYLDGQSCKRDADHFFISSYGRGVGTPLVCASDEEYDAGLCYKACRTNYMGVGPVCWGKCRSGYNDTGLTCHRWWKPHTMNKPSYGRGVGAAIHTCPDGKEKDASLCYPFCKEGYNGIGPVCWQTCDQEKGYKEDNTVFECARSDEQEDRESYNRGTGSPTLERWMTPSEAASYQQLEDTLSN